MFKDLPCTTPRLVLHQCLLRALESEVMLFNLKAGLPGKPLRAPVADDSGTMQLSPPLDKHLRSVQESSLASVSNLHPRLALWGRELGKLCWSHQYPKGHCSPRGWVQKRWPPCESNSNNDFSGHWDWFSGTLNERYFLILLISPNMWIFHTKYFSNSLWMPTGCPTIWFDSDTNYLWLSDPIG